MSGKQAKRKRANGTDRRSVNAKRREEDLKRKAEQTKKMQADLLDKKLKAKDEHDIPGIIENMSEVEKGVMMGKVVPDVTTFENLIKAGLVAFKKHKGKPILLPTVLGLVVADVLNGDLEIIPPKKLIN